MISLGLLDDYPEDELGHHPDLLLGLARSSRALSTTGTSRTWLLCPGVFLAGASLPAGVVHRNLVRSKSASLSEQRRRLAEACCEAADAGIDVLVNLFLDETHQLFPVDSRRPRIVQTLHRPAELAVSMTSAAPAAGDVMRSYLGRIFAEDLFVVHTSAAYQLAARWLPPERLLQLAWPAASSAEVDCRFTAACAPSGQEPHALLIGDARDAKGVHELLTALAHGGPLLRIVGQQYPGVESELHSRYPGTRVEWESGWISRERLDAAIAAASVVVFPYLETFGRHGGVSGALAQAVTFAKPLVVSSVLAPQAPASQATLVTEPGDVGGLRRAIEWAIAHSAQLHEAARGTLAAVRAEHTYEGYLTRILERVSGLFLLLSGGSQMPTPPPVRWAGTARDSCKRLSAA